ncbi:MAG: NapC/NirT family cytochrome c [Omnitrophica WOR_2 bacterium]
MRRVLRRLKAFFLPPAGSPTWMLVLPFGVLGVLTLILLSGGAYAWDYTNSPSFCGNTCHTMPPEYTSYMTSPHARIDCVDCHIGKSFIATRITRKAGDLRHVFATTFKTYEFPIRASDLRPARETCERCHFPEKFSDDSLRQLISFENDTENSPKTTYLILKTGGGSQRLGLGRGIHWHIVNQVYFYPADVAQQEIPYVRVIENDGSVTEYKDIESDIQPSQIKEKDLVKMDCITCHNRITHKVPQPEETVDTLISRNLISPSIPDIRKKAVEVYSKLPGSIDKGLNGIASLANYYQSHYPDYFVANKGKIDEAIAVLQETYRQNVFPEQNSDWTSHPNNVGHKYSPGCFRCHDGKHMNAKKEAIRLECNLCHSIPVVAGRSDFVTNLEISRGPEPQSHLSPNWISMHHVAFNTTCSSCHKTENPGGRDNTSFCSNSACHGSAWKYAGFDAPALRELLVSQLPPTPAPSPIPTQELAATEEPTEDEQTAGTALPTQTPTLSTGGSSTGTKNLTYKSGIGELFSSRCGGCHGTGNSIQNMNLTTYEGAMKGSSSGPVIKPGDPKGSLLVQKQSGDQPHFGQLSPDELQQVIDWISAGALE